MKADLIISRVEKARLTGRGSWVCCCPAHADKNPSMTVRETDDGLVLLHCFAGCGVEEILGAIGLAFDALFPDKPIENAKPLRRPFPAADVLECVAFEALVVVVASSWLRQHGMLTDAEIERLRLAERRISDAREIAFGWHVERRADLG